MVVIHFNQEPELLVGRFLMAAYVLYNMWSAEASVEEKIHGNMPL